MYFKKIRMIKLSYANSKIYKIINPSHTTDVYVGATTMELKDRLTLHINHYKRHSNGKVLNTSTTFNIIKDEGYTIELIEAFPCSTKEELCERESYYINSIPNCINKRSNISKLTKEELKEKEKEKAKIKYVKNIDKFKQYYIDNKDKIKERYEKRKEEKWHCDTCDVTMVNQSKNKHLDSNKHKNIVNALDRFVQSIS